MEASADFFSHYASKNYAKGSLVFMPDNEPAGIYYVTSGRVRQYDISQDGKELVVNVFKPGSYFPMAWAINKEPNKWYFEALTDCVIRVAPATETMAEFRKNIDMMYEFVERLCSGAAGQQRRMVHMMGGTARTRVIYELIVEFKRFGVVDGNLVSISLSETDLSRRCGLSREAVNKCLNMLKQEDLITRQYRKILISSPKVLEQQLGLDV